MRYLSLLLLVLLCACTAKQDPLIGRWTVEKVNVEFNENIATPEMVRQYGEMEKGNVIEIGQDSTLVFVSDGETLVGHCSLQGQQLYQDSVLFGHFEEERLVTEEITPLGKVTVCYKQAHE